ncbi:hypothetical protein SASPL_149334 [Salvia splendens]|uniref:Uncharacterized protein n=1 Tax=Salvia splendens TaxID=180675 RepID=A0A8X8WBY6_SALSN|nr:hypothetical protein SASPL_149334 [Salvia splendens]
MGAVSYKADVCSFGMMLIDRVGLKRDLRRKNDHSSQYFPYWIYDCFEQGKDIEIEEANEMEFADENEGRKIIIKNMTIVALWCILMSLDGRPSMNKVLEMLEGDIEHLHIPSQSTQIGVSFDQIEIACSSDLVSLLHHVDASIEAEANRFPPPRIMIFENRLLAYWSFLIIMLHLLQASHASLSCTPSHCGIIPNISHPFRLKGDPMNCGDSKYELACENNVTVMYLSSHKYLVKSINYGNSTIRLVDASITDEACSFPKHSTYSYNFRDEYPFSTSSDWIFKDKNDPGVAWPINIVSCPYRLEDSSNFTDVTGCFSGENSVGVSNSSRARYTYVKVGGMTASDVRDKCSVDLIVMTSLKFKDFKNVTLSRIHDALLYGFELSWFQFRCIECKGGWECTTIDKKLDGCSDDTFQLKIDLNSEETKFLFLGIFWFVVILLLVLGCRLEVLIIAGFSIVWGLLILSNSAWFFNSVNGTFMKLLLIVVISYAAKIIIAYPCVMGILVYKFRRRHLSSYDDIEGFLQSDNQLVPIRGTIGYVAPELISRSIGAVSYKADVYSFGMLLMEMVGLKRDLPGNANDSSQCFPYWIYDCYNQGKDVEFGNVDEISNEDNERVRKTIRKMTIVALWCTQMSPNARPSMNKVMEMLEGDVEHLQIPDRPSESIQVTVNDDQSYGTTTATTSSVDQVSLLRHTYPSSSLGTYALDSDPKLKT